MSESLPPAPERAPDFADDFTGDLSPACWVPHYLPHWTEPERSAARYRMTADGLELRIEHDQLDWRPDDAPLRVSNIQTATFSGAIGSPRGTHRHRPDGLVVRTATPERVLFAPSRGRIDVTLSASTDEGCMIAAWLVGIENTNEDDAGEICIVEIDASAVGPTTIARTGVKAHHDPGLTTDMSEVELPFDASRPHTWTVIWGDGETIIGCEGVVVRRVPQAPDYSLMLLIDLFETAAPAGAYPKTATVRDVRGWAD
ncbi:family 16 glycosylhydrolase [Agromyces atrinae]|uniref:Glycosyl hydrolase family protein n=1 Tax=Agromyces atrinae TaxID=592376 RepID=A0A4Q2M541_9MICO|nr:family 16 glycosylhydrolase [Agromyces atrinae]NYD66973.1 hypothetical protein [Agromyces atrinae]RXZ85293.1 glycosyl hydrolase family protein [Agromyces atrinae]RXZ85401.1 glycosyl hydrolase family protein [Agromyces atrinae]